MVNESSRHVLHSLYCRQFLDELRKLVLVVNHHRQGARKTSILRRLDADATHHHILLLVENGSDIVHNTYVIVSHDPQCHRILFRAFACPARPKHTIAQTRPKQLGIRTILTVYLDATIHRHEPKHIITIYRIAALGKTVFHPFQVIVQDQHISIALCMVCLLYTSPSPRDS